MRVKLSQVNTVASVEGGRAQNGARQGTTKVLRSAGDFHLDLVFDPSLSSVVVTQLDGKQRLIPWHMVTDVVLDEGVDLNAITEPDTVKPSAPAQFRRKAITLPTKKTEV